MKRNLIANYTEATVTTVFTSAVEALISSADFVKVKGKAVLDQTLTIREAATGTSYTLEYGEETPLLDGSQGIYCTKDTKEPSVKLTIKEYTFDSYSEEGEGQRKTTRIIKHASDNGKIIENYGVPEYQTVADLPPATGTSQSTAYIRDTNTMYTNNGTTWDKGVNALTASGITIQESSQDNHILIRNNTASTGTRIHIEPNDNVVGTTAKLDFMMDPFDAALGGSEVDYRIGNLYTKSYDPADTAFVGNNGIFVIGAKALGEQRGVWPTIHFGYTDDGPSDAVPLKLYYFDTSDTVWRTPMIGSWRAGRAVTTGDYVVASYKIYQASTTGTTGATRPTHATGTVSDGAVDWLFIRDVAVAAAASAIKGCVVIGNRDSLPKFGHSTVRLQLAGDTAVWNNTAIKFLNASSVETWKIYDVLNSNDLRIEFDSTHYIRLSKDSKFVGYEGLGRRISTLASTDSATPTISGTECLIVTPTTTVSITSFTNAVGHQVFCIEAGNAGVTLVHGTNLKLRSGANYTMSVDDILMFKIDATGLIAKQII